MCFVTATELKKNLSYYIKLSQTETVYITKNKKIVSSMSYQIEDAQKEFLELEGCMKKHDTGKKYKEMLADEIKKRNGF